MTDTSPAPRAALVTGGCGFLGRAIVDALVARGDEVTVLDHNITPWRSDVQFVRADVCDPKVVEDAVAGQHVVIHNASLVHTKGSRVDLVRAVNLGGTRNVLGACQRTGVPRLVYISSASVVYEGADIRDGDERLPYARTFPTTYAETKRLAEEEVLAANGQHGVLTCALRPHLIFGPADTRLIPALIGRAREGKLKVKVGRGDWLSDFTYVSNIVDAVLAADERLIPGSPVPGQAYFITNGEPITFWEFVGRVLAPLGYPPPRFAIPGAVAYAFAAVREAIDTHLRGGTLNAEDGISRFAVRYITTHHFYSHAKATRDLGYHPRVSLTEGIERTVAYFREHGGQAPQ